MMIELLCFVGGSLFTGLFTYIVQEKRIKEVKTMGELRILESKESFYEGLKTNNGYIPNEELSIVETSDKIEEEENEEENVIYTRERWD